jgi:ABC-2 type transport system ATP-binding protein
MYAIHSTTHTDTEVAIRARGLTKSFGGTRVLAGVDLAVPTGSLLALLGPNGSGKTTAAPPPWRATTSPVSPSRSAAPSA